MAAEANVWIVFAELMIGIGAIAAIVLGIREYHKGQKWQKAQILLSLIDSFESDKQIKLACQMLDYDERDIFIDKERSIQFKNEMLISALRVVPTDTKVVFTPEDQIIRDAFDAFFDFFHKLYAFKESALLTLADYTYFYYWLEVLRIIGQWKENMDIQKAVREYIVRYHFIGIQDLLKVYSKHPVLFTFFEYSKNAEPLTFSE